jgi:hypothetical protein
MSTETTRRVVLVGGASVIATTAGISTPANAFLPRWIFSFTVGVAAGWMLEALKHWGLVPGSRAPTSVTAAHEREVAPLARQGYSVSPMYSGAYSRGDFELSEATRGDEFLALGTTNHGRSTCTPKFDKADTIHVGLVSSALRSKGFDTKDIETCVLPLHPNAANRFIGDRRHSPDYMTPSHGTIAWSTNVNAARGNFVTAIRSPVVNANLRFAHLENGKWTFDMVRV